MATPPSKNEVDKRIELVRGHGHDGQPENGRDPKGLLPGDLAGEIPGCGQNQTTIAANSIETA
jgi:hypothetical protein